MPSVEDVRAKVAKVAVVIPVGPETRHAEWLDECLLSVAAQTVLPDDIVIVDDMHGGALVERADVVLPVDVDVFSYRPPWRLGVAHAFNAGSAVAFNRGADLALMLGADDTIQPRVIESLVTTYEREDRRDGFYFCEVHYSDGRPDQMLPCNCAAWTPGLFKRTGGFPVESASGACDAAFVSQFWSRDPDVLVPVPGRNDAWFMHRVHEGQQTKHQPPGMDAIRDWLTTNYKDTNWGRY